MKALNLTHESADGDILSVLIFAMDLGEKGRNLGELGNDGSPGMLIQLHT